MPAARRTKLPPRRTRLQTARNCLQPLELQKSIPRKGSSQPARKMITPALVPFQPESRRVLAAGAGGAEPDAGAMAAVSRAAVSHFRAAAGAGQVPHPKIRAKNSK